MVYTMTAAGTSVIAPQLEGVDLTAVYDEYLALIPTLIPIAVSCIAITKGIGFLLGTLRSA